VENVGEQSSEKVFERACEMLGSIARFRVLRALAQKERVSHSWLAKTTGLSPSKLLGILQQLEDIELVSVDLPHGVRQGRAANYMLDRSEYERLLTAWVQIMLGKQE